MYDNISPFPKAEHSLMTIGSWAENIIVIAKNYILIGGHYHEMGTWARLYLNI